jgi:hypothetical protein
MNPLRTMASGVETLDAQQIIHTECVINVMNNYLCNTSTRGVFLIPQRQKGGDPYSRTFTDTLTHDSQGGAA